MKKLVTLALLASLAVAAGCQKKEAPVSPVQGKMSSASQAQASSAKK